MCNCCIHVSFDFNGLDTYEESLQKLTLAQDTSNIDDTGMSSEEQKQQRRVKAKRKISSSKRKVSSSSSKEEEICLKNKENKLTIKQTKVLPPFPDRGNFLSTDKVIDKSIQNITNILHEKNDINSMNSSINGEL